MDGLSALAGLQSLREDNPFASAEERSGDTVDPRHSFRGEVAEPYSWESKQTPAGSHGPYGPQEGLLDETLSSYGTLVAGSIEDDPTAELAPWTHAAPHPIDPIGDGSESPDNIARQLYMSAQLHAINTGGKRNVSTPTMYAVQDHWSEVWEVNPNGVDLSEVPGQIRSGAAPGGRGGTDRTQSNARQNSFGFDSRHMHRRFAVGSIPGNYMWMKPGGRPLVKSLAGPARPAIGPDSPFEGHDLGAAFAYDTGAILQDNATEYEAPPTPYYAPAPTAMAGENMDYSQYYGGY